MLVSVTASVSKPDLAAAQLHDNTCNPAAQLGICGTLGHSTMKTNVPSLCHQQSLGPEAFTQAQPAGCRLGCHAEHFRQSGSHWNTGMPLHQLLQPVLGRAHQLVHLLSVLPDLEVRLASSTDRPATTDQAEASQRGASLADAAQRRAGQGAHLERGHRADASFGRHGLRQSPRGALVGCHPTYPRVCLQRLLRQHPRRLLQSIEGHAAQRAGEHAPRQRPRPP